MLSSLLEKLIISNYLLTRDIFFWNILYISSNIEQIIVVTDCTFKCGLFRFNRILMFEGNSFSIIKVNKISGNKNSLQCNWTVLPGFTHNYNFSWTNFFFFFQLTGIKMFGRGRYIFLQSLDTLQQCCSGFGGKFMLDPAKNKNVYWSLR